MASKILEIIEFQFLKPFEKNEIKYFSNEFKILFGIQRMKIFTFEEETEKNCKNWNSEEKVIKIVVQNVVKSSDTFSFNPDTKICQMSINII